jgi:hypothetical protein
MAYHRMLEEVDRAESEHDRQSGGLTNRFDTFWKEFEEDERQNESGPQGKKCFLQPSGPLPAEGNDRPAEKFRPCGGKSEQDRRDHGFWPL